MVNLHEQAWTAFEQGDYAQAEALFGTLPDPDSAFGLGYVLAFTGRFDEARHIYAELRMQARETPLEHIYLHQLGMVERMAGDWAAALARFEEESELIAGLGNPPLPVSANAYELGTIWQALGELEKARAFFEQAVDAGRTSGDLIALGCAERGLGDWHAAQNKSVRAREHWQAAQAAFAQAEDEKAMREIEQRLA